MRCRVNCFTVLDSKSVKCLFSFVHVFVHAASQLFFVCNPFIFDGIRKAAEDVVRVAQSFGQDVIHLFVLRFAVDKIEHVNELAGLTESFDAA